MANPRTGYPDGYFIYLVKQVEMGMRRPFEELIARHGISTSGYTALNVLQFRPGITSSEVARRSFVRAQTMAETISALSEAGLVRREKDPDHGRQILLSNTEAGVACVAGIAAEISSLESRMMDGLGDAERADLIRALRVVRDALAVISHGERAPA